MPAVAPYIIKHIHLEQLAATSDLSLPEAANYYCVFWWRQIPLGHLFLEQNKLTNTDVPAKAFNTIEPTIDFYIARHELRGVYKKAFLNDDYRLFKETMDAIFSTYQPSSVPETADISVIICTRNRSKDLQVCLQSLMNQACVPKEIIVVDNNPTDEATKHVVAQFESAKYVLEPRPGLSIARNTGIQKAGYPIIAWVDDDVVVHPLWTYRIWEVFQTPGIAAVTGLVLASELNTESQQIFEKHWTFNRGYTDKVFNGPFFQKLLSSGPPVWNIGAGANMAFRKAVFEEVGLFDERLGAGASGCSEDSEMWYRILAKGMDIHYTPRAVVFHKHRAQMAVLEKQLYSYMQGFTVAALIQQLQDERAGYRKHLYYFLPKYYTRLFMAGFPKYRFRYRTLLIELKGVLAGLRYYRKHKDQPAQMHTS